MNFDGASNVSSSNVKSSGFDYSFSFTDDKDDVKKNKFDMHPGGIWTMPNPDNVAFRHSAGDRDNGAHYA